MDELVFVTKEDIDVTVYTGGMCNLYPLDVKWMPISETAAAISSTDIIVAAEGGEVTVIERQDTGFNEEVNIYHFRGGAWTKLKVIPSR